MQRGPLPLFGLLILLPVTNRALAAPPSAETLLETLRAVDEVYEAGLTVRGLQVVLPPSGDKVHPPIEMQLGFTLQQPRHGIILRATRDFEPDVSQVDDFDFAERPEMAEVMMRVPRVDGIHHGMSGTPRVGVLRQKVLYFDDKLSSHLQSEAVFLIGPNRELTRADDTHVVNLAPWDNPQWTLPYKKVMWGLGRGFARYVDRLASVSERPDGLLEATGPGHESGVDPGTWKLIVDPGAGYLVREAAFGNDGNPTFSAGNSGLIEFEGGTIPESASFQVYGTESDTFTFTSATLSLDEEILRESREAIESRQRPNTLIADERSTSAIVSRVDGQGKHTIQTSATNLSTAPPTPRTNAFRNYLIGINVALVLILALIFLLRRKSRDPSPGAPTR